MRPSAFAKSSAMLLYRTYLESPLSSSSVAISSTSILIDLKSLCNSSRSEIIGRMSTCDTIVVEDTTFIVVPVTVVVVPDVDTDTDEHDESTPLSQNARK